MRTGLTAKQVKEALEHCIKCEEMGNIGCTGCPCETHCIKILAVDEMKLPIALAQDAVDILNPEYALPEILYRRIRVVLLKAIKGKEIDQAEAKEVLGWIMRLKKEAENK